MLTPSQSQIVLWAFTASIGLLPQSSFAVNHPFHISTAEVEFNAESGRLEVGLKLQSIDLDKALSRFAGKKVDSELDKDADELIKRYVGEHFYLAPGELPNEDTTTTNDSNSIRKPKYELPKRPDAEITFVGKQFETKWVWVFFEFEPPKDKEKLLLVNTVLFEINDGQINTTLLRKKGLRPTALKTTNATPPRPSIASGLRAKLCFAGSIQSVQ